jgi:hypothetical protein
VKLTHADDDSPPQLPGIRFGRPSSPCSFSTRSHPSFEHSPKLQRAIRYGLWPVRYLSWALFWVTTAVSQTKLEGELVPQREPFSGFILLLLTCASSCESRLASSLSLTSTLSASVVLASRLATNTHVFALVLFSVVLFALAPSLWKRLRVSTVCQCPSFVSARVVHRIQNADLARRSLLDDVCRHTILLSLSSSSFSRASCSLGRLSSLFGSTLSFFSPSWSERLFA